MEQSQPNGQPAQFTCLSLLPNANQSFTSLQRDSAMPNISKCLKLLNALKRCTYSVAFRSGLHRFPTVKSDPKPKIELPQFEKPIKERSVAFRTIKHYSQASNSAPSIPDARVKYGYSKTQKGEIIPLIKDKNQLELEVNKMRHYRSSLHENVEVSPKLRYKRESLAINVSQALKRLSSHQTATIDERVKPERPLLKQIAEPNKKGIAVLREKEETLKSKLGPGAYEVDLNTIKAEEKQTRQQFFGSTQIRFKASLFLEEKQKSPKTSITISQRNIESEACKKLLKQKLKPKALWHLKKEEEQVPPSRFTDQVQTPGPGDYQVPSSKQIKGGYIGAVNRFQSATASEPSPVESSVASRNTPRVNDILYRFSKENLKHQPMKPIHKSEVPMMPTRILGELNRSLTNIIHFQGPNAKKNQSRSGCGEAIARSLSPGKYEGQLSPAVTPWCVNASDLIVPSRLRGIAENNCQMK